MSHGVPLKCPPEIRDGALKNKLKVIIVMSIFHVPFQTFWSSEPRTQTFITQLASIRFFFGVYNSMPSQFVIISKKFQTDSTLISSWSYHRSTLKLGMDFLKLPTKYSNPFSKPNVTKKMEVKIFRRTCTN